VDVTAIVKQAAKSWDKEQVAPVSVESTSVAAPRKTQRRKMRELVRELGFDRDSVVRAYVHAESRGEIQRIRNQSGVSAEEYAAAL